MSKELKLLIVCFSFAVTVSLLELYSAELFLVVTAVERATGETFVSSREPSDPPCMFRVYAENLCLEQRATQSSLELALAGLARAEARKVEDIEVPLSILVDDVVIGSWAEEKLGGKDVTLAQVKAKFGDVLRLEDFMKQYATRFSRILFRVENIFGSNRIAANRLRDFSWSKTRDTIIAKNCDFLSQVLEENGILGSCISLGVLGNWALGFPVWAVEKDAIVNSQLQLLPSFPMHIIIWSFEADTDGWDYCELSPTAVVAQRSATWDCRN